MSKQYVVAALLAGGALVAAQPAQAQSPNHAAHAASTVAWRPSVFVDGDRRIHADHRRGMLFSRFVPSIFMAAWAVLAALVLTSRRA